MCRSLSGARAILSDMSHTWGRPAGEEGAGWVVVDVETSGFRPGHARVLSVAALALDLMEEFRPWADRLALTLINRGQLTADDFVLREGGGVLLEPDARKAVVVAFQERKHDEINHPLLAQSVPLGLMPLVQARLLARAVREDGAPYVPFVAR